MSHLRLVARFDVKALTRINGVRLEGLRFVGSPSEHAARYSLQEADEIHGQDIVASLYSRGFDGPPVSETASEVFIPLLIGGGLRSVDDVRSMLRADADCVAQIAALGPPVTCPAQRTRWKSGPLGDKTAQQSLDEGVHSHG